jgi:hypothetical protein
MLSMKSWVSIFLSRAAFARSRRRTTRVANAAFLNLFMGSSPEWPSP